MTTPQTIHAALVAGSERDPDGLLLLCDGGTFTYRDVLESAEAVAAGLVGCGLRPGDRVAILTGNSPQALFTWLGVGVAGGVDVPVNADARGASLDYILDDIEPRFLVVDEALLERLDLSSAPARLIEQVIVLGGGAGPTGALTFQQLLDGGMPSSHRPAAGDHATIMYTSGTTGAPKGVMLPHGYYPFYGAACGQLLRMSPDERLYCAQPLFHIDGRMAFMATIMSGGSMVLRPRFSASRFWEDVAGTGSTRYFYVGAMIWMLSKREPTDVVGLGPTIGIGSAAPPQIHRDFEARFDTVLLDCFGMTEAILVSSIEVEERRPGTMGRPLSSMGARLVDAVGRSVPAGSSGEIVLRPEEPNIFPLGYWRKPQDTVQAWRDLWFHTGDVARADADGYWTYVGRSKDSIRRRGENVSAWEVEQCFVKQDVVREAAAFGVPSELGEEDIAIVVVLQPGSEVTARELCSVVAVDLPYFMVPRYVEFVTDLPKTPSHRVEKSVVRSRGLSAAAWDAVADGWDSRTGAGS